MDNDILIAQGDITDLAAEAVVYSTSRSMSGSGQLHSAFCERFPQFEARLDAVRRQPGPEQKAGDTGWIPLAREHRPHGIVPVVATGADTEEGAAAAVAGAIHRACAELDALKVPKRWLIALPAIRLGYGGDRRQPLRSARVQLAAARAALREHPGVDVAFVPYTPDHYQVYLEARRQLRAEDPAGWGAAEVAVPAPLADALRRGECVLFAGSGLSAGAGLPSWGDLAGHLAAALGLPACERDDLDYYLDLAQWFRESEAHGTEALRDLVRGTFDSGSPGVKPTLAHYLLTSLPLRYIVTTNYDDLLERALRALRRYPVTVVEQEEVAQTGRLDGIYVVKFHGDAKRGDEIVLSRDDYEHFFRERPAMALLLEGLLLNQTFLFVGYSLRDPDFRQIHHRVAAMLAEAKRPAFAATLDAASPHLARQWARKQVNLLSLPAATPEEGARRLTRFLDRLAEEAVGRRRLLLAPDAAPPGDGARLRPVQEALREVGERVEAACAALAESETPCPEEAEQLEWALRFLTEHGWRPESGGLTRLWRRLATHARTPEERQGRLVMALAHTDTLHHAQPILQTLDRLSEPAELAAAGGARPDRREAAEPDPGLACLPATTVLLEALEFAADRHRAQRRKDQDASPYINHPIAVARVLAEAGGITDPVTLAAALLHDTLEDTQTTAAELEARFGAEVRQVVEELTDDKSLPKQERKRLQVEHAPHVSSRAKLVKLGDKICNVRDVTHSPPAGWPLERRREYLDWTERVVAGCRGVSPALEHHYDALLREGRAVLDQHDDSY